MWGCWGALFRGDVGNVVHHKGAEGVALAVSCVIAPGNLKLVHVARIHLFQRRIVRTVGASEELCPAGVLPWLLGKRRNGEQGNGKGETSG